MFFLALEEVTGLFFDGFQFDRKIRSVKFQDQIASRYAVPKFYARAFIYFSKMHIYLMYEIIFWQIYMHNQKQIRIGYYDIHIELISGSGIFFREAYKIYFPEAYIFQKSIYFS